MNRSTSRRLALRTTLLCASALVASPWAAAQSAWPTKPVTIIVPFPAGGGTDAFARPLFALMSKNVGKQFIMWPTALAPAVSPRAAEPGEPTVR